MNSSNSAYEKYKMIAQSVTSPCAILSVEKNEDGTAGDIRLFATNDKFSMTGEMVEGELYTKFLPREPKFDDMCLRAAFGGEKIHTYVDSTKTLGAWSDNILLPLQPDEDGKTGYCQFIYDLTKEMDAGKFSTISPTVAGFVIKSCLELRSDNDFKVNINQVIEDIRIFTDATFACVISMNREKQKSELICQSIEETAMAAGQSFSGVSFDTIDKWDDLIGESDCFIMRDKADIENVVEKVTPKWAQLLRMKGIENLCLVPLQQRKVTVGYILVTNFNLDNLVTIKETLEILSLFVSSEMANNQFLARLEWLTSVDMRTGVRNRAAMNRVVDEYAEQLKWQKYPIGVDDLASRVVTALSEKRMAGKKMVVGQDADLEACQRIVEGTQLMTVYKPIEKLAQRAAECAVKMAKGEEITQTISGITTKNDGAYDVPYLKIDPVSVNADNMDEVIINSGFHLKEDVYLNVPSKLKEN